jgi:hypothetical protein
MSSQESSGSSLLLSSLLVSVLPNVPGAKTEAVTISDDQWEDVLWDREADGQRTVNELCLRRKGGYFRYSRRRWIKSFEGGLGGSR